MSSKYSHSRTQSAYVSHGYSTKKVASSGIDVKGCHSRSGSINTNLSNISRDHLEYSPQSGCHAYDPGESLQVAAPPRAAAPLRPALGSRFLSSLANAQPTAAAITRKGSALHSRAKSLAAFVPKLTASNASTTSERSHSPSKLINDFFGGESAPIRLGAPVSPTKEKEESEFIMEYLPSFTDLPSFTERPTGKLRRAQTTPQNITIPPPTPKSSWFKIKSPIPTSAKIQPQDELANVNINDALFPNGPADPLDPSAFNDLLLNAWTLLQRMQAAYKEKVEYIASIRPEMDAQQDEIDGAETRATHLKNQLEDMSKRAQEQETTMKEMARELAEEKIKAFEAQQALAAAKTIRVVPDPPAEDVRDRDLDLQLAPRKKRGSSSNDSDSGFESEVESIFSSYSVPPTPLSPPPLSRMQSFESRIESTGRPGTGSSRENLQIRSKANFASSSNGGGAAQRLGREGAAWATVEVLRSENKELKGQLQGMHEMLQDCIDLVSSTTSAVS